MATIADVERGKAAGEFTADTNSEAVIDAIIGALYYRLLLRFAPLTEQYGDALVEHVLQGARRMAVAKRRTRGLTTKVVFAVPIPLGSHLAPHLKRGSGRRCSAGLLKSLTGLCCSQEAVSSLALRVSLKYVLRYGIAPGTLHSRFTFLDALRPVLPLPEASTIR